MQTIITPAIDAEIKILDEAKEVNEDLPLEPSIPTAKSTSNRRGRRGNARPVVPETVVCEEEEEEDDANHIATTGVDNVLENVEESVGDATLDGDVQESSANERQTLTGYVTAIMHIMLM